MVNFRDGPDLCVRMGQCEHCWSWFEEWEETDLDHPYWPPDVVMEDHDCDKYLVKNIMVS